MPVRLGEVAAGRIGNYIYVVGQENRNEPQYHGVTLAFNIKTNTWLPADVLAKRPFAGNHHTSIVKSGKWYLFGGLDNDCDDKL